MQEQQSSIIFQLIYHMLLFFVRILLIVLIVAGCALLCRASYRFGYEVFGSVSMEEKPGQDRQFVVEEEDTMYQVAQRLEEKKLIADRFSFYMRTEMMSSSQTKLRPGKYMLNTSMDYQDIINELTVSG